MRMHAEEALIFRSDGSESEIDIRVAHFQARATANLHSAKNFLATQTPRGNVVGSPHRKCFQICEYRLLVTVL